MVDLPLPGDWWILNTQQHLDLEQLRGSKPVDAAGTLPIFAGRIPRVAGDIQIFVG